MQSEKLLVDLNSVIEQLENEWGYEGIREDLYKLPTVDAAPVVHGRWENIKHFAGADCFGYCSNCKTPQKAQNAAALKGLHRYCRWCGAKMDGGNEDGS